MRVVVAVFCVLALPVLPADEWDADKETQRVRLRPERIGKAGNGPFTLAQALAVIGEETGNAIEPGKVPNAPTDERALELRGETFWEAIEIVVGRLEARPRRAPQGMGPRGRSAPLAGTVIDQKIDGLFRITLLVTEKGDVDERSGMRFRDFIAQFESEPRLPYFSAVSCDYKSLDETNFFMISPTSALNHRWGNLNRVECPLGEHPPVQVRCDIDLHYFYDWRFEKVDELSEIEAWEKTRQGEFECKPRPLKEGVQGDQRWVRVSLWNRLSLLDSSDFQLHLEDGTILEPVEHESIAAATFVGVPEDATLEDLTLHLRVPQRTKSLSMKLRYEKPAE